MMTTRTSRYRSVGNRLIMTVTGRRTKWLVVVTGVVLVGVLGPLAAKLTPLERNSPTSFLPASAASTQVLQLQQAHARASTPALVIYERSTGLTSADKATIGASRSALASAHLAGATTPGAVVRSTNGRSAYFEIPIASKIGSTRVTADVKSIRAEVSRHASSATATSVGLRVAVGGAAGSVADAAGAFSGIDGKLLGVTVLIVAVLLLLIYRSPVLWLLPLISVGLASGWSQGAAYGLARAGFTVNAMTVGILTVLVFGAGTDYALLLVARYREELRRHEDHHEAMAMALRRAGPSIATSGLTVVLALLCLLVAQLSDIGALGPACAAGIVCALAAQLIFLPALLVVVGRRAFWPLIPRPGDEVRESAGHWGHLGQRLAARPRPVWIGLTVLLVVCSLGLFAYTGGVNQANGFRGAVGSVAAEKILAANFLAGDSSPTIVVVPRSSATGAALAVARGTPGVVALSSPSALGPATTFDATLSSPPSSNAAEHTVIELRQRLAAAAGPGVLVGGQTATNVDISSAASHDRNLIFPLILAVVLVMLAVLLRSMVAPLVLVATVALSYLASLGVSAVVFRDVFGFPGFDASVPIFGFVFLVALGVDYNIFLMARVREEAHRRGARQGVVEGLAVTGSVITSAGAVLAATFAVLGVLPLIALTEVGFLVAFGVLIDTILVRSALVPALAVDIGPSLWWPSPLVAQSRTGDDDLVAITSAETSP